MAISTGRAIRRVGVGRTWISCIRPYFSPAAKLDRYRWFCESNFTSSPKMPVDDKVKTFDFCLCRCTSRASVART